MSISSLKYHYDASIFEILEVCGMPHSTTAQLILSLQCENREEKQEANARGTIASVGFSVVA